MGYQALVHLLDPFLRLSLLCQRPATQDRTERQQERKSLFLREDNHSFGVLLGATLLAAELMEYSRTTQSKSQAKGVSTLLCQGQCVVDLRQPLVGMTQIPQRPSSQAMTNHPSILPIAERSGAVLLGVVERHPLCQVRVCSGDRTQEEQRHP